VQGKYEELCAKEEVKKLIQEDIVAYGKLRGLHAFEIVSLLFSRISKNVETACKLTSKTCDTACNIVVFSSWPLVFFAAPSPKSLRTVGLDILKVDKNSTNLYSYIVLHFNLWGLGVQLGVAKPP